MQQFDDTPAERVKRGLEDAARAAKLLAPVWSKLGLAEHEKRKDINYPLQSFAPSTPAHFSVMLEAFEIIDDYHVRKSLLRYLQNAKHRFDGAPLCRVFEKQLEGIANVPGWQIADTLSYGFARVDQDWLCRAIAEPRYGRAREMLCYAVAKYVHQPRASEVLRSVFDVFPGHVAGALRRRGTASDLEFLKSHAPRYSGWIRRKIDSVVKSLEKRLIC